VRRLAIVILVVLGLGGAVGAVWFAAAARPEARDDRAANVGTELIEVTRGTVAERVQVSGTLGFDGAYHVIHHGEPGVLTAVAAADTTVSRGGSLYAVAGQPVRLLYGATPAYRAFGLGMTDGPDVRQLEENLVALGMDPHRQIVVDAKFTAATANVIRRWQTVGSLPLGRVVFQPGPLRVSQVEAAVGTSVAPDAAVLSATSSTPVVTAQVSAERRRYAQVGDQVMVTMSGVAPFPGTVARVGRVATAASTQGGNAGPPTVAVTITVTLPPGAGDLDQAPVVVAITRQTRQNVLMVPVTALQARPGGGYQVRLSDDRYVQVEPGLFDSVTGQVEVTGDLTAGQRVKAPAT
jgi:hypothetical protein